MPHNVEENRIKEFVFLLLFFVAMKLILLAYKKEKCVVVPCYCLTILMSCLVATFLLAYFQQISDGKNYIVQYAIYSFLAVTLFSGVAILSYNGPLFGYELGSTTVGKRLDVRVISAALTALASFAYLLLYTSLWILGY